MSLYIQCLKVSDLVSEITHCRFDTGDDPTTARERRFSLDQADLFAPCLIEERDSGCQTHEE